MKMYQFEKAEIPDDTTKGKFMESLLEFGVPLLQYKSALELDDVTM